MSQTREPTRQQREFLLWSPYVEEGGVVVLGPYLTKYRGGVSPRDAVAMARVYGLLSALAPKGSVKVEITDRLSPEDRVRNLLLIGSASGNAVVRKLLDHMREDGNPLSFSLATGCWTDGPRSEEGLPANLVPEYVADTRRWGAGYSRKDFGIVAQAPNPFQRDKVVTFVAGIHGYGTLAAAEVFCSEAHQREIQEHLLAEPICLDPDHCDRHTLVEVMLRATISSGAQAMARSLRALEKVETLFVRVDRDLQRQSCPVEGIWKVDEPEPRLQRDPHRFSIFFDDVDRGAPRALVALQGRLSLSRFCDLAFTALQCNSYDDAVVRAFQPSGDAELRLREIGRKLADDLAPAMIHAPGIGKPMRDDELLFHFAGPAHHLRLPLEATRINDDHFYLGLTHPVVRSISGLPATHRTLDSELMEELRQEQGRLRFLLVAADPLGDLPAVEAEVQRIKEILKPFQALVEVTLLTGSNATATALQALLSTRRFHALHYAGHSFSDPEQPHRNFLLLCDGESGARRLYLDELNLILQPRDSPLAFCYLSACEGAAVGGARERLRYDFLGTADSLVRAGVPAVLAFRDKVQDTEALLYAESFYKNLLRSAEVDLPRAMLQARQRVHALLPTSPTWLMPILLVQH